MQPRTKTRGTTLVAMMFDHYLFNSITLRCVGISAKKQIGSDLTDECSFFSLERTFCKTWGSNHGLLYFISIRILVSGVNICSEVVPHFWKMWQQRKKARFGLLKNRQLCNSLSLLSILILRFYKQHGFNKYPFTNISKKNTY